MKYKKVGENRYRKCMSIVTEVILMALILIAFLVLGAVI